VAYTCKPTSSGDPAEEGTSRGRKRKYVQVDSSEEEETSSGSGEDEEEDTSDENEASDEEDRQRSKEVQKILERLTKSGRLKGSQHERLMTLMEKQVEPEKGQDPEKGLGELESVVAMEEFVPDSFVVVPYDGDWYVGQVMEKEGEPEADERDEYVLVNFMKRSGTKNEPIFQWPDKVDHLNVLVSDIFFKCSPPVPNINTSSSRSISFSLTKDDLEKARVMFVQLKANCPIKFKRFFITGTGIFFKISFYCCTIPYQYLTSNKKKVFGHLMLQIVSF